MNTTVYQENKASSVLLVGQPNAGKSSIVNAFLNKNQAITLDKPGVTRDLIPWEINYKGYAFKLIDSGGVYLVKDTRSINNHYQDKIEEALQNQLQIVTQIWFVVDAQHGLTAVDEHIAKHLYPFKEKVTLVVNKADDPNLTEYVSPFYKLGFPIYPISALNRSGLFKLISKSSPAISLKKELPKKPIPLQVVISGRPNAGKSSLLNLLSGENHAITSPEAGTTRDPIHIPISTEKGELLLIDTAGMRRNKNIDNSIEFYSLTRTKKAIQTCDATIVIIDIQRGFCKQDKIIISECITNYKNILIFVNKIDTLSEEITSLLTKDIHRYIEEELPSLKNFPIVIGSVKKKLGIHTIIDTIFSLNERQHQRIATPEINQFIQKILRINPPPSKNSRPIKIYYGTQTSCSPVTFVFFVNNIEQISDNYKRFLENKIRTHFDTYNGIPIKILFNHHRTKRETQSK